jgi:hypothetical protein
VAIYTALFDTNVLYSMPVTDIVLELASTGLFRARWSDDIHDEWVRHVIKDRPDLPMDAIQRRRRQMDIAIPQAFVTGYNDLIEGLALPDPDDRHVLAAAIVGRADVIVTFNINDFPADTLAPYGIEVQLPDDFLNHQRTLNETLFLKCVKAIRARLSKPKYAVEAYIEHLRSSQLQVIAAELEKAKALI